MHPSDCDALRPSNHPAAAASDLWYQHGSPTNIAAKRRSCSQPGGLLETPSTSCGWDCESSLYDSFELQQLDQSLDRSLDAPISNRALDPDLPLKQLSTQLSRRSFSRSPTSYSTAVSNDRSTGIIQPRGYSGAFKSVFRRIFRAVKRLRSAPYAGRDRRAQHIIKGKTEHIHHHHHHYHHYHHILHSSRNEDQSLTPAGDRQPGIDYIYWSSPSPVGGASSFPE